MTGTPVDLDESALPLWCRRWPYGRSVMNATRRTPVRHAPVTNGRHHVLSRGLAALERHARFP